MNISKLNEAMSHKIVGGSEYQWKCFGHDARFLDYESDYAYVNVVYDSKFQEVYEAQATSKDESLRPYRWINPSYKDLYLEECKEKNVDPNVAWDDVHFIQLETFEDFLTKSQAIFEGKDFDKRIEVPIDLDKEELFELMSLAHKRDITLNRLVEEILKEVIEKDLFKKS